MRHSMKVSEVMTPDPVVVSADAPVRGAAGLLRKHKIGGLPVMDGKKLVGVITESDILKLMGTPGISDDLWLPSPLEVIEVPIREAINWAHTQKALSHIGDQPVRKVMSHPVVTIGEDEDIDAAAAIMVKRRIARLPVVREGKLVGIVARADIVRGLGESHGTKKEGDEDS
jgi:CBS domain-containing protein